MSERLYYADATCLVFDATVSHAQVVEGHHRVTLDRTAFYPTSGGQPFDTGTLGGRQVNEVFEEEDGSIVHVLDGPLDIGARVEGRIDRDRRRDHTQQHTGQHILSAAFDTMWHARTVGFHLGAVVSTLDLDTLLTPDQLAAAEDAANRIVWENRPVHIRFADAQDAAALQLRKESHRTGALRIIEVEGFDRSACGGTHVTATGEVGTIAVRAWEKLRGGLRIEFVCGGRALREFRVLRDVVAGCIRVVSVAPVELPAAIERIQQEQKGLQRTVRGFQEQLAAHLAAAMVSRARRDTATTCVVEAPEGWDLPGLKMLASQAISAPGVVAVLLSATEPRSVVIGRSPDVTRDAGALLRHLTGSFGGKGGGKPELAQGGGLTGSVDAIAAAVRAWLDS